jgi:2,3-bisphosphoglycerate-dependent phosphoglycerate mutase
MSDYCTVLLIRHGQTQWNTIGRYQGWMDSPLTDEGVRQAQLVASGLATVYAGADAKRPAALYVSDLGRAIDTAKPIGAALGLSLIQRESLREKAFGIFEGHTEAEFKAKYPAESQPLYDGDPHYAPPGGESLKAFADRVLAATREIALRHLGQTVLCVTHGGVLGMHYRAAKGLAVNSKRDFPILNASVNEFRIYREARQLEIIRWGDVSHLPSAEQPDPYEAV